MQYLAKYTGVVDGYRIGEESDLDANAAAAILAAATGDVEAAVDYTDDMKSEQLFGWDPDEGDDEKFWAAGLSIRMTMKPEEYVDLDPTKIPARSARLSIAFTGNNGWLGEVGDPKTAFKDKTFLPGLEKILGVSLDVVAISS